MLFGLYFFRIKKTCKGRTCLPCNMLQRSLLLFSRWYYTLSFTYNESNIVHTSIHGALGSILSSGWIMYFICPAQLSDGTPLSLKLHIVMKNLGHMARGIRGSNNDKTYWNIFKNKPYILPENTYSNMYFRKMKDHMEVKNRNVITHLKLPSEVLTLCLRSKV